MNKADYIWLTRNTQIDNVCANVDDCDKQDLILKLYRKHHLDYLKQILGNCETEPETGRTEDVFNEGIKSMKTKSRVCRRSVKTTQARA